MTRFQRIIKYCAIALALFLAVSIVVGGVSVFGMIFGLKGNNVLDDFYDVELSQDIEKIEIDVSAASVKIIVGERFLLSTNIENLIVDTDNSYLYIKQPTKHIFVNTGESGEVIITIPANSDFESFELDAGAGEIDIERLCTQYADIDMGAGALTIRNGKIEKLELDLGVGETNIAAKIGGNSKINCGVGETNLNILGDKNDYTLDIDAGIGSIEIDGMNVKHDAVIGNGKSKIEIDGDVGRINIDFIIE